MGLFTKIKSGLFGCNVENKPLVSFTMTDNKIVSDQKKKTEKHFSFGNKINHLLFSYCYGFSQMSFSQIHFSHCSFPTMNFSLPTKSQMYFSRAQVGPEIWAHFILI